MLNIGIKLAANRHFPDLSAAPPGYLALQGRQPDGTHAALKGQLERNTPTPLYGKAA